MYSDFALEQEQTVSTFSSYWNKVKTFIPTLISLPTKIAGLKQEALGWSIKTKNESLKKSFKESSARLSSMYTIAIAVKEKIDKYLPHWQSQEKSSGMSGFGLIPLLVLGAVAMGALAYVSVKGLALLKQYSREKEILDSLKSKALSLTEATALIREVKEKTVGEGIGVGIASALTQPLLLLAVAGGAYFLFMKRR